MLVNESASGGGCASAAVSDESQDTFVLIATKVLLEGKSAEWLLVNIQNMDGNSVQLLVMPQATVLQMKHAVAQAVGTPAFQQTFWAEGAEEEMKNMSTAAGNGLSDNITVFLIKGDAASWQMAMLNEPQLFKALGDFMALSKWREEGGYEQVSTCTLHALNVACVPYMRRTTRSIMNQTVL
jgi:hypothetical protein